ncbi:hypothetical protein BCR39DRAFT_550937 [Naematelia encephala]|uniref:Elongator complex protein 5 n=1 Tax=Naematelia encephala TaxID=71784 RepID=A0A1Y2AJK6_9TREE|nr:hypothetical protein BCR39DRAFT_550937 [Naematelia encephala]
MTYLTPHLPFSGSTPALPPPKSYLIISDTLQSPAHWALYHLFAAAISEQRKIVLVDFRNDGRASLEAVLRKLGTTLPSQPDLFTHIFPSSFPNDSPSAPSLFTSNDAPTLRPTYQVISESLDSGALVVLDGLSDLVNIGFSVPEVGRFVRAVLSLVRNSRASLVSTLHADELLSSSVSTSPPSNSLDLLERLLRIGSIWWRVQQLSTGRSSDVHGEISCHILSPPTEDRHGWTQVPKANPLQYRLEERTVRVFPKGTGRGYL